MIGSVFLITMDREQCASSTRDEGRSYESRFCEEIVQNQNVSNQDVDQEFRFSNDYLGIASSFLLDADDDQEIQMADQIKSVTLSVDHNENATFESIIVMNCLKSEYRF